jgi:hypothetical protein
MRSQLTKSQLQQAMILLVRAVVLPPQLETILSEGN